MFLPGRGVRPLGRGGAFTAGADDLDSISYNPAGLGELADVRRTGGRYHLAVDLGLVSEDVSYTRVDSGGVVQPTVRNSASPTPIPTVGLAVALREDLVAAVGLFAPYTALPTYPLDGPQRYSLVSLDGTVIANAEAALAWAPSEHLRIGGGLQLVMLNFSTVVVFTGCPGSTLCTPEDRDFDAASEVRDTAMAPSGNFGVQGIWEKVRLGAAVQLPTWISSQAKVRVPALPRSAYFDNAHIEGDRAQLEFTLPLVARVGIELRPGAGLRVEGELDYEAWSLHDAIKLDPRGMRIVGAPGTDSYDLGSMTVRRNFDDTFSLHLGVEWAALDWLTLRGGWTYEPSAVPDAYMSVLTPDGDKQVVGVGAGLSLSRFQFNAVYAHVAQAPRDIHDSASYAQNPVRPPAQIPVGNGHYDVSGDIFGVGLSTAF
jgi:long-chain fatty acid transport protein